MESLSILITFGDFLTEYKSPAEILGLMHQVVLIGSSYQWL